MLTSSDFCLNRCAAGGIRLPEFMKLANELGIHHIELRTDIHVGSDFLDDISPEEVLALEKKYDVFIVNIGAIFNLDKQTDFVDKINEVKHVVEIAQKVGSPNIFFTPVRDKQDPRSDEEKFVDCVKNVHVFSKILAPTGVNAMIEPMGFPEAALRKPWIAQKVLDEAGASNFKLVADTFHYYGAEVTKKDFDEKINVGKIGIVHLSSITADKSPAEADDDDRYYLADNDKDVMHSLEKVKWIKDSSYTGLYSFEPCAKAIDKWSYEKIRDSIKDSMEKVINA